MGRHLHLIAACCVPASLAMAGLAGPQPLFLINTSPSEPLGLYVRVGGAPGPGRLGAFPPPAAAQAYARAHLPEIGRGGILKTLVGEAGDQACAENGLLTLNGGVLAPIRSHDSAGRALPHWTGCRILQSGEHLAFSNRVPNSFDSRYYGPIAEADLIGIFEPLWTKP